MFKRLAALAFIFLCTSLAWVILGATIFARTYTLRPGLKEKVAASWGAPHLQQPPTACYYEQAGKETRTHTLPLDSSRIKVGLDLEHRQKGLLWYSTYKVAFAAAYVFRNPAEADQEIIFIFRFPVAQAVYDDLVLAVDGVPLPLTYEKAVARGTARLAAGRSATLTVGYRSQGLDSWRYALGGEVAQVRDFTLQMTTNFRAIDFPDNTLSPSTKRETPGGWELTWAYKNLVSGFRIGMAMPEKLQPGPLAGRISYFAPVSLLFFFFLMFIITALRRIELHPMNYFFLAAAFFSFHLLLAYLVDHISIHTAFLICSAVSLFLVISYLRLVAGMRFAALEAGGAQLLYLVLFSYAFFWEGFTGLAITVGAILTLFAVMQLTGKTWGQATCSPGS